MLDRTMQRIKTDSPAGNTSRVTAAIERASAALRSDQKADGHWLYELEADATIPAEYILLVHFLGEEPDPELEGKIGTYLRRLQAGHGGWPLYFDGEFDMSASVKAYFALKMIGDDPASGHMTRARQAVLAHGGAERANVFTRILLALYGIVPWRAVPQMPVEIMLLPRWSPFGLDKISYWARTVIVPLLVLQALRPRARNLRDVLVDELFVNPPNRMGLPERSPHQSRTWSGFFRAADAVLRVGEPFIPKTLRKRALSAAVDFVKERQNGENGLGAIFPAMVNAVLMYDALGLPPEHPDRAIARRAVDKLLVVKDGEAYCQPCLSPVWDTVLAASALIEAGGKADLHAAGKSLHWLLPRQECQIAGDWARSRPDLHPGGWAFQYTNPHYPDLDDTAVIVMAMKRWQRSAGGDAFDEPVRRASEWIKGLQSRNGGWAAFDADNTHDALNNIPFADHGALLDPPTPDLAGRCVSMLGELGETVETSPAMRRGVDYLLRNQRRDGSWFGRWGINYIYGTWSALTALRAAGMPPDDPVIRKAAGWLVSIQNPDGGWGEDGGSYSLDYDGHTPAPSTPTQAAWALLALMAANEVGHSAVEQGAHFLLDSQQSDGLWSEPQFTGTGFPRVFYLRYHGYPKYFPLWALARYRKLKDGGA